MRTTLRIDVDWQEDSRSRWPWRSVWTADGKELGRVHYDKHGYFFAVVGNKPSKRTHRLWEAVDNFKRAVAAAPEVERSEHWEPVSENCGTRAMIRTENKVAPAK